MLMSVLKNLLYYWLAEPVKFTCVVGLEQLQLTRAQPASMYNSAFMVGQ